MFKIRDLKKLAVSLFLVYYIYTSKLPIFENSKIISIFIYSLKKFLSLKIYTRISILGMTLGTYSERLLRRKFNIPKDLSLLKKTEE